MISRRQCLFQIAILVVAQWTAASASAGRRRQARLCDESGRLLTTETGEPIGC